MATEREEESSVYWLRRIYAELNWISVALVIVAFQGCISCARHS